MISRPTALDPVNAIAWTPGCPTSIAPASPWPGRSESAPGGTPASRSASTRRSAQPGDCSAGLRTTELPAASAAVVIPAAIANGKFQGRDDRHHAARPVRHRVALAGDLRQRCALAEPDSLARVVLAEVDRLADVRVRLGPRLRALPHGEGGESESPVAQDRSRLHEDFGAPLSRAGAPFA